MRVVGSSVVIVPHGGDGERVFRPEARRFCAINGVPDERVIVFDETQSSRRRFDFVCREVAQRIVPSLSDSEQIRSVVVLAHGWKSGDQFGADTHNVEKFYSAFRDASGALRLARDVTVVYWSCSNGGDTPAGPRGEGSFADVSRDVLCRLGCTGCQVFGHLDAGHATWHANARWFKGEGNPQGGEGGQEILGRDHPLFRLFRTEMKRSYDPDGEGPQPMTGLRFLLPWMESDDEVVAYLNALDAMCRECGREGSPNDSDLRAALVRGGYLREPAADDDLADVASATVAAVKAFQRASGLDADGIVGVKTWGALRRAGLITD